MAKENVKTKRIDDFLSPDGEPSGDGGGLVPEELRGKIDELLEVGVDSISMGVKLGVLQRVITAAIEEKEVLQVLLTAAFDNKQEALLCADAISECQRYGVPIMPLLTRVTAQCSIKAGRVNAALSALTNQNRNYNYSGKLPDWKRRQNNRSLGGM